MPAAWVQSGARFLAKGDFTIQLDGFRRRFQERSWPELALAGVH